MSVLEIPVEDPRGRLHYPLQETRLRRIALSLIRPWFHIFIELDVAGAENLPPAGAVIVAANHLTNIDIFLLQFALQRPLFYMGKAELFQNPIVHALFRQLGAFPVYRGSRDEWAQLHARRVLEAGQVLGMFPEGTRSRGRGLKVAKTGAARLALEANCPIVPVAIDGSQYVMKRFPRRTRVRVTICEPIFPHPGELPLSLTDRLMFTLAQNLPPNLRGVYAEVPVGF